jgi:hypothetical protein
MDDDVSSSPLYPPDCTNAINSQEQFLQPPSKTTTLPLVTMEVSRIAVVPTRTTRALTKISRPSLNLRLGKNSTPTMTVAPATAMQKWRMPAMQGKIRNDRKRSRRPRTERAQWACQPPQNVAHSLAQADGGRPAEGLTGGESTEHHPKLPQFFDVSMQCMHV